MSDETPVPPAPGGGEPPTPADAAQKKQTVRISLPPRSAAGGSVTQKIKLPTPGAAPAARPAAAAPAPAAAAPAPAPAAAPAGSSMAKAPAAAPGKTAAAPAPAARPAPRPRAASPVGGLEVGLAFAVVAVAIGTVIVQFILPFAP